ncbi:hypothetical protein DFH06DRAFT_49334 [Mycena polygramma]|nr:hypothetical protein DFH06DRAFT_49334 [Mycena polygramma]
MNMHYDKPKPMYTDLVSQLRDSHPELAYLHVDKPRLDGIETLEEMLKAGQLQRLHHVRLSDYEFSAGAVALEIPGLLRLVSPVLLLHSLIPECAHGSGKETRPVQS